MTTICLSGKPGTKKLNWLMIFQGTVSFTEPASFQTQCTSHKLSSVEINWLQIHNVFGHISDYFAATHSTSTVSGTTKNATFTTSKEVCLARSMPTCFVYDLGTDLTQQRRQDSTRSTGPSEPERDSLESSQRETRGKPSFPNDHPFLVNLRKYLQSRHGRNCSEREAHQISDVSKYLHFACSKTPKKELLLNCSKVSEYLRLLEPEVKASTQNAKLNRIRQGIKYLALGLDSDGLMDVQRIEALIKKLVCRAGKILSRGQPRETRGQIRRRNSFW